MHATFKTIGLLSRERASVLVRGETGGPPLALQAGLLRFLECREFTPRGGPGPALPAGRALYYSGGSAMLGRMGPPASRRNEYGPGKARSVG